MLVTHRPLVVDAYQFTAEGVSDFPKSLVGQVLKVLQDSILIMCGNRIVPVNETDWILDNGQELSVLTHDEFVGKYSIGCNQ